MKAAGAFRNPRQQRIAVRDALVAWQAQGTDQVARRMDSPRVFDLQGVRQSSASGREIIWMPQGLS
jgi:hypothetical protein